MPDQPPIPDDSRRPAPQRSGKSSSGPRLVQLTLGVNLDQFKSKRSQLRMGLARFLGVDSDNINIRGARAAHSTVVSVELPAEIAGRLLDAYETYDPNLVKEVGSLRLLDEYWPPNDDRAFVQGAQFHRVVVELCQQLVKVRPAAKLEDASAKVFTWFDGQIEQDPRFISGNFPTRSSFLDYVKQALTNSAEAAEDERRRQQRVTAPPTNRPIQMPGKRLSRAVCDHMCELIESLSEPEKTAFIRCEMEGEDPHIVAAANDWTLQELAKHIERALDFLRQMHF